MGFSSLSLVDIHLHRPWKGCLCPFFPNLSQDKLGYSHAGIRRPRLSSATSALKLSISLLISYLGILALSRDKLWQPEDTQASSKQIDIATAVFQYEIVWPQKCNSCIINQSLVVLEASVTFYLWKQTHRTRHSSVRMIQTVNPLASPPQQANDTALSEHLRSWQTGKGRIGLCTR